MMRIVFIAFGTRGDVQPILALGKALKERGHRVRVVASSNFKAWIEQHGLEAATSDIDIQAVMMSEGGYDWIEHGNNPMQQLRVMKKLIYEHGPTMMRDAWRACRDAEVIVSSFTSDVYAASIAEKLRVPHISTPLQPALVATRSGKALPSAPVANRDSIINYLLGKLVIEPSIWSLTGELNNRFRRDVLDLPTQTRVENRQALRRMLVVLGYSPQVVPHPSDWPSNIHTAGYWFLDEDHDWQPPRDLRDFINGADPPVFIGFGSMTGRDPQKLTRLLIEAVTQSGQRAVLQSGWASLGDDRLPPNVFCIDAAPHHKLFPLLSAVVHHGGSGTTAQSLRVGVPTIIVPHMADQPFWGARVAALGVGPRPIPRNKLTVDNLAAAIREATGDRAMRERASALGAKIRAEDGIGAAMRVIEAHLQQSPSAIAQRQEWIE